MPRTIDPALLACLDRENPSSELAAEIHVPDVTRILQRPNDQLLQASDPLVSLTPASSIVAAAAGGVALASTSSTLVSFLAGGTSPMNVDKEDPATRIKGVSWAVDPAFDRCLLRSFTARLTRSSSFAFAPTFELQVYRASGRWGVLTKANGVQRAFFYWDFIPLLATPAVVRAANITWSSNQADVVFDLTTAGLVIDGTREALPSNAFSGQPTYYFAVRQVGQAAPGSITWKTDAVTSRVVSGVGTFDQTWWSRTRAGDAWAQQNFGQVPWCEIKVENYAPSGGFAQAIYKIDLGRVPSAGTTGRVRFERSVPLGCTLTAEISTAGSGGSWTTVVDGDIPALAQQIYHLRITWTPSASHRATPTLIAAGVEYRTPYDVSREAVIESLPRDIEMPYCAATIGDAALKVLRTGRRDYSDTATVLGSTAPTTKLEVDVYLRSPHPNVTRAKWLRVERATVDDRVPGELSERFLLLSYLAMLQREIPLPVESINSVYTVQGAADGKPDPTATQIYLTPALQGATGGGTEYTGKNYFMRVRTSSQNGTLPGTTALITSHTSGVAINFGAGALNGILLRGDVVEIHSGVLVAPVLSYKDWDPAAAWWDLFVNQLAIPAERIGLGHLPRGGLPPTVVDRAPGDATTQAQYKVSLALEKPEKADKLIDQLSFIMGGATVEIAGQICFVQLYPLRNGAGDVTVPLQPSSRTFDPRDYLTPQFPQGLRARQAAVTCAYGVDMTVASGLRLAAASTEVADSDAINWLTLSPNDNRGRSTIPSEISRWCYNSNDHGLKLATELAYQIVLYFGTGLRIWEWSTRDSYPQHHAGDVVTVVQNQYTDYDPVGLAPVAGWQAVSVVLLGVSANGRKFRGVVPGLNPNTIRRVGGNVGSPGTKAPAADLIRPIPRIDTSAIVEVTSATETVVFSATPGGNSAGPLTYRYRIDLPTGVGSYSAPASFPHAGLAVTRLIRRHKIVRLEVTDASSGLTAETTKVVEGWVPHLDIITGTVRRDYQLTDGAGGNTGYAAWGDSSDPTGGTLASGVQVKEGTQGRSLQRGYQSGTAKHGDVITFSPAFVSTPSINIRPANNVVVGQPAAGSWAGGAGYNAALATLIDLIPVSASPTGFTIRAQLRQKAAPTNRNIDFGANTLTTVGAKVSVAVANAPSNNGLYTVRYNYTVTPVTTTPPNLHGATLVVRINKRLGGAGGTSSMLDSNSYGTTDTAGGAGTTLSGNAARSVSAALVAADFLEVELFSLTGFAAPGTQTAMVHAWITATDGAAGISFTTAAGADPTASMTPDTGDLVFWEATGWQ